MKCALRTFKRGPASALFDCFAGDSMGGPAGLGAKGTLDVGS
jgi:hypothetical protein